MAVYHLDCAQLKEAAPSLRAGDRVLLSGTAYTARDAAHKRIAQALEAGEPLPFALEGAVVYYAGPTPAPAHLPIGSCGPTTSGRMDVYTPDLLDHGIAAMIGKGGAQPGRVRSDLQKRGRISLRGWRRWRAGGKVH